MAREKTRFDAGPSDFKRDCVLVKITALNDCSFSGSLFVRSSAAALLCLQPVGQHCPQTEKKPVDQEGSRPQYHFLEPCFVGLPPARKRATIFLVLRRAACSSSHCRSSVKYMMLRYFLAFLRRQQQAAKQELIELFFSCQHPSFFGCANLAHFTLESRCLFGDVQKYLQKSEGWISYSSHGGSVLWKGRGGNV